ncbi:MAG: hypothetical protein HC930_17800 [Hydrococcus sp. SU_1_0]|nr:hypothetical protein [Hydrococcus sp. SU_1_0]
MKSYRLTAKDASDLSRLVAIKTKTLGEILREADLVSTWQIESALQDKTLHPDLRIGEILAQKKLAQTRNCRLFCSRLDQGGN